eukprot:Skav209003  [mRNA]  locus=scaffold2686:267687:268683:- [translate_table: standard]
MPMLTELLGESSQSDNAAALDVALKVIVSLLAGLRSKTGILVVLQFEQGTNLFEKTAEKDLVSNLEQGAL